MGLKGFRERAKAMKDDLLEQHQHQHQHNDDKGATRGSIIIADKIPEGIEEFRPGIGDHIIDVIPFYCGKQHPTKDEGRLAYVVDVWVHRNIGVNNAWLVCQSKTWGETDLMCEYINMSKLGKKAWSKVRAYRRTVYLIWDHTTPEEEEKGLQWWHLPHFFFEEKVTGLGKDKRTGQIIPWSHHDYGKSVGFTIGKGSYIDDDGNKQDSTEYTAHGFIDRIEQEIPDSILAQSFALDEAINMHPTEEEYAKAAPFAVSVVHGGGEKEKPDEERRFNRPKLNGTKDTSKSSHCVMGHRVLGQGFNKYDECQTCAQYDACGDANSAMSSAEETPDAEQDNGTEIPAEEPKEKEQTPEEGKKVARPKLARRRPRRRS